MRRQVAGAGAGDYAVAVMGKSPVHHPEPPKLSRNISFHLLWSSTLASGFGDRMAMLAVMVMLGFNLTELDGEPVSVSSIDAAKDFFFFLPYMLWGPFAGWLADRLPRKWLMFFADEMRGLVILYAYVLLPEGHAGAVSPEHHWKIYGLMFAIGMLAATFSPARTSVIPNVVGLRYLQRANAVVLGLGVIGNLLGFLVGGPIARDAARWCVFISACCYLVSGSFWIFLKTPAAKPAERPLRSADVDGARGPGRIMQEIVDGGRYVLRHRPVLALTFVSILFWGGTSIVMAAGTVISVKLYGGSIDTFAFIAGAFGFGMLIGAILLGILNTRYGGDLLITAGMIGTGLFLALLMIVPVYGVGLALAGLTGVFGGILMITINTMLQQVTPDGMRGRVFGFKDMASDIAKVAASLLIWQVPASDFYMVPVGILFGVLLIVLGVYAGRTYGMAGPHPDGRLNLLWRINRLYAFGFQRLRTVGAERIPREGALLLVSNHTAGLDPALIQAAVPRPVRWVMTERFRLRGLGWLWRLIRPVFVQGTGRAGRAAREAIRALHEGDVVGIFPEGGINRGPAGEVRRFHAGAGLIAAAAKDAMIVPVAISGTPRTHSVLGSYLRRGEAVVHFGEPTSAAELEAESPDGDDRARRITTALRNRLTRMLEPAGTTEH